MTLANFLGAMPGTISQGLIWGIMAIGLYITYKVLNLSDLTVDGSICTGGAVCVMLVVAGVPVPVAMLGAIVAGMLCGLVTGLLHTFMGIPAILAGILTQLSLYSVNLKIMGKPNVALSVRNYDLLISLNYVKNPLLTNTIFIICIILILLIAVLYWYFGTEMGCGVRATGDNQNMARAQGINTEFYKVFGLILSNGIVALAGAMLVQYQGFCDVSMGRGAIVIGLASIVIGKAMFGRLLPKNFACKLLACALGGVVYYIVYQTVILLGLDADLLKMLSAIVVAIFLAVPYWKKKYFTKAHAKGGVDHA